MSTCIKYITAKTPLNVIAQLCRRFSGFRPLTTFHAYVGRENKTTNNRTMLPTLKNNAAAGYKGPVKIELLKGAGLLHFKIIITACKLIHLMTFMPSPPALLIESFCAALPELCLLGNKITTQNWNNMAMDKRSIGKSKAIFFTAVNRGEWQAHGLLGHMTPHTTLEGDLLIYN